jgi:hypothetical protein
MLALASFVFPLCGLVLLVLSFCAYQISKVQLQPGFLADKDICTPCDMLSIMGELKCKFLATSVCQSALIVEIVRV